MLYILYGKCPPTVYPAATHAITLAGTADNTVSLQLCRQSDLNQKQKRCLNFLVGVTLTNQPVYGCNGLIKTSCKGRERCMLRFGAEA